MRHAMHAKPTSRTTAADLGSHQVAVDPWRVIQFLEQRRSEKLKRAPTPLGDLNPKLVDLFARLKTTVRSSN